MKHPRLPEQAHIDGFLRDEIERLCTWTRQNHAGRTKLSVAQNAGMDGHALSNFLAGQHGATIRLQDSVRDILGIGWDEFYARVRKWAKGQS